MISDLPPAPPIDEAEIDPHQPVVFPRWLQRLAQVAIILTTPIVLILGSVRLVMTEAYIQLEYRRPGFPEDLFGFTTDDRLEYGPYGIRYIVGNHDISYLADLEIDGKPAFNADELQHMEDVQVVTHAAFQVLLIVGSLTAAGSILLARQKPTRHLLPQSLRYGGFLTMGVVAIAFLLVLLSWDFFFDSFHEVFFAEGTWQFSRADTLIRLYPEQFWFDAAISIGILTTLGTAFCIALPRFWKP